MNVSDLLRRPGSTREVHLEVPFTGLENLSARVDADQPITLDLRLESLSAAIVASGRVRGRWSAVCSRCLTPLEQVFDLKLREVFEEDPIEDETYPLRNDEIDLEQPVRDLVVPDLPIVPLCDPGIASGCARPAERTATKTPASAGASRSIPAGMPCGVRTPGRELRSLNGRPQEKDRQGEDPGPGGRRAWRVVRYGPSLCPHCHQTKLPHVVCPNCGWYGGRQAVEVE